MNESATAGVGAGVGSRPKGAAEVDVAEVVGVDVCVGVGFRTRAVVGVRREVVAADPGEVVDDRAVTRAGVCPKPRCVTGAGGGVARSVAADSG